MSSSRPSFAGAYTALVTPFRGERLDEEALERLVETQIQAGIDGLVAVGTTGESPTLSMEEHVRVIELCVRYARGRKPVIAGTGANATTEAVDLIRAAEDVGADAHLQVAPYYNKPGQEGLFRHFLTLAESATKPILLYNIPGRCGVDIAPETVHRLAEATDRIVGIKEAGGNVERVSQLGQVLPPDFTILSGDDSLTLPFMAVGARGVISVASNLIPGEVARMVRRFNDGDARAALALHQRFYPLFKVLFIETNPAPVKAALALRGLIQEELRLPLTPVAEASRQRIREVLVRCGLLS